MSDVPDPRAARRALRFLGGDWTSFGGAFSQAARLHRDSADRAASRWREPAEELPSAAPDAAPVTLRPLPDTFYRYRPIEWARDVLGIPEWTVRWSLLPEYADHEWDGTVDPLAKMLEAMARGLDVAVESGTGTGKTFTLSWVPLWFIATRDEALGLTTAPIEKQLRSQLWRYMGRHWRRFSTAYPRAKRAMLRVRMSDPEPGGDEERWAVLGWGCGVEADKESATRAQGFHAKNMCVFLEETPGIPLPILNAFLNTSGGQHNQIVAVGNPDSMHDTLHQFWSLPGVTRVRISSLDHPNVVCQREVIEGAISSKGIEKITSRFPHGTPMWNSRIRGVCPTQGTEALIRREWCDAAVERWQDPARRAALEGPPGLGVDAAQSEAGDKGAIAHWKGGVLQEVIARPCPNAQVFGVEVWAFLQREKISPLHCGIDAIGVGASTVNECHRLAREHRERTGQMLGYVQAVNVSLPCRASDQRAPDGTAYDWAPDASLYYNLRSQMYWQLREDLQTGRLALPPDEALILELTSIEWRPHLGLVRLEEKAELRKRLGRSPDRMDAVVIGNWTRPRRRPAQVAASRPIAENRDTTVILPSGQVRIDRVPNPTEHSDGFSTFSHLGEG